MKKEKVKKVQKKIPKKDKKKIEVIDERTSFSDKPFHSKIKPRHSIMFNSNYFEVDGGVGSILTFPHKIAADDNFPAFWGMSLIPNDLSDDVTTINFEHVSKFSEADIRRMQKGAERYGMQNASEIGSEGSDRVEFRKQNMFEQDLEQINTDLLNGDSYLRVYKSILIKAKDKRSLDITIEKINRDLSERLNTITSLANDGRQRDDMGELFNPVSKRGGNGYEDFTTSEYAGGYNIVTNGITDVDGELVGRMEGDVNISSIILNLNSYNKRVVIGVDRDSENYKYTDGSPHKEADQWGVKIGQSALMAGKRVVHLVFNDAKIDQLGLPLSNITSTLNMGSGDVNMFHTFVTTKTENYGADFDTIAQEDAVFASNLEKLVLMFMQLNPPDTDINSFKSILKQELTSFYVKQKIWASDPVNSRDMIKLELSNVEYPTLEDFKIFTKQRYETYKRLSVRDDVEFSALRSIHNSVANTRAQFGSQFNKLTSDVFDSIGNSKRVVFDFSDLFNLGSHVAMAQLANVLGLALRDLGRGDTVVFHGVERIDPSLHDYISTQLDILARRGGRSVFIYTKIESMLKDYDFNDIEHSDFTIMSTMTPTAADAYQNILQVTIPQDLTRLITDFSKKLTYVRRGYDNVVFKSQLALFPKANGRKLKERLTT